MKIVSGTKMGEIDRLAMTQFGIPGLILMENAGLRVVKLAKKILSDQKQGKIAIFCGKGNNGGDGFVIARHLRRQGYDVETWAMGPLSGYKGDAEVNYDILLKSGDEIKEFEKGDPLGFIESLKPDDLIIDALLGTGLQRPVRGLLAEIITAVNNSPATKIAVDIPSGISANSGEVMGVAVKAHYTVTFALPKRGLLLFPGAEHTGVLYVADIGIPQVLISREDIKENLITGSFVQSLLPTRSRDGHKGSHGRVLILAGSPGMTGAAALAGEAALRGGAGLVYLGTAEELRPLLEAKLKEVIVMGFPGDGAGNMISSGSTKIFEQAQGCQALAFGPGLKAEQKTLDLLKSLAGQISVPFVVDAGGLGALSLEPEFLNNTEAPFILTPHPGEMARLIGSDTKSVQKDRWALAAGKAKKWQKIVVLKGAHTVVALPEGEIFVNPTGNPVLSTAGTGDLLTGLIASFAAQGLESEEASVCGVYLHGLAADLLAASSGQKGNIAGDVLDFFPEALNMATDLTPVDPELYPVKPLEISFTLGGSNFKK